VLLERYDHIVDHRQTHRLVGRDVGLCRHDAAIRDERANRLVDGRGAGALGFEDRVDPVALLVERSERAPTLGENALEQSQKCDPLELVVDTERVVEVEPDSDDARGYFGPGPVTIRTKPLGRIHFVIAFCSKAGVVASSRRASIRFWSSGRSRLA